MLKKVVLLCFLNVIKHGHLSLVLSFVYNKSAFCFVFEESSPFLRLVLLHLCNYKTVDRSWELNGQPQKLLRSTFGNTGVDPTQLGSGHSEFRGRKLIKCLLSYDTILSVDHVVSERDVNWCRSGASIQ